MINLLKKESGFGSSTFTGLNGSIPFELEGKLMQVDEQTYQDLKDHKLMWQNGTLVSNPNYAEYVAKQNARKQKVAYRKELNEIQAWFKENDWKPNKIITGEWLESDSRWLEYKRERAVKRARQDYLNDLLKTLN